MITNTSQMLHQSMGTIVLESVGRFEAFSLCLEITTLSDDRSH